MPNATLIELHCPAKFGVTRQDIRNDLLDRLKEHDLSFILQLLADIAEEAGQIDSEDESESWLLDSLLIRTLVTHILH
jgi:hypothetical protein